MKFFRIIFVSLIAVGVCGGVYIGLTFGLAAYMNYKTGGGAVAAADDEASTPTSAEPGKSPTSPAEPQPQAAPAPGMDDAAALLRRTWTAPRQGLTSPPPADHPSAELRKRIAPVGVRPWSPTSVDDTRPMHLTFEQPDTTSPAPTGDRLPVPADLPMTPPTAITFPAAPPAKASSPKADVVPLSAIGANRVPDRPSATDDPTERAGEALLMQKPAPPRTRSTSPETLAIPEPNPYVLAVRTELPEEALPPTPGDRPEAVVFPVK